MVMREGLTYSDVLLVPKRTPLKSRREADVQSFFTKNVSINVPLVSVNMATVTEHKMAIAMARCGGIGIIHQFNTIEEQAEEVRRVKRSTSYVVRDPKSVSSYITLKEAKEIMNKYCVSSLLVENSSELAGILTSRDYVFEQDDYILISDLMTPKDNLVVTSSSVSMDQAKALLQKHRIEKLPLVDNGRISGLITKSDIEKLEEWPQANRDERGRLRVSAAIGVKDAIERGRALVEAGCDVLVLDIAHCHSDLAIQAIKDIKRNFPSIDLMAGNIATGQGAQDLIEAGVDGIKIGIGPSPVCTTRVISGAGIPQLTAIMDVVSVAKMYGIPVCADGGAKYPGDFAKAIAAGASTLGSGSMFAGTKESPGHIILKDGKRFKRYMGSASYDSNHERKEHLEKKKYKQRIDVFVEGVSKLVDYKGPVQGVIEALIKGLQSGISYCGARNIKEMQANAEFIKITSSGWKESLSR
jgi:IMP dehydrogenase